MPLEAGSSFYTLSEIHKYIHTDRQADRQTDRQTETDHTSQVYNLYSILYT